MTWHKKLRWYHRCFLLLICCWVFFGDGTFAQSTTPIIPGLFEDGIRVGYDQWWIKWFTEWAEQWLKILYLILRPMLAVAAAAMDNSLVYGGAFYLTNALFQFRQIIRTFANYTIGLYFVGSILAAFFWNKLENVFSWLLKNVTIAAILVNMSRWILAALIDLSTLATVSLWALPLHALGQDPVFKENVYFMKTFNNLNLNASTAQNADSFDFSIMYGCTEWEWAQANTNYFLPCPINDKWLFYQWATGEPLTREQYKEDFKNVWKNDPKIKVENISDGFCVKDKYLIKNQYWAKVNECKVLQELMVLWKQEAIKQCATVDKILTKSVNMSWPLFTIFSSILNMSEMWLTTNSWSIKEVWLNLLIKLVFWIALIVPLIALAVVMVIRVVYLRLIIAFSPLITIAIALQRWEGIWSKIEGVLSNVLKPTQIVSLIFLPVIAVFWLSISIIFLSLLKSLPLIEENVGKTDSSITADDGCYNDPVTALGMQRDETDKWTVYYIGPTKITISDSLRETGADIGNMMSWLVINLFGIALMWMVVFATLKTNEFTKWIAETIDKTAKDRMGTVPLPLAGGIGLTTLQKTPELIQEKLIGDKLQQQEQLLDEFAMSYDPETKELKQRLVEGQTNPGTLSWLNDNNLPQNTDFQSDYQAWGKAYAQKAKSYFYDDKTKQLTNAWKSYAATRFTPEQIQNWTAASTINSSLDNVTNWNDALGNQEFVHRMHSSEKWYDNFLNSWDKRAVKTNRTVETMEQGLRAISKNWGQHAETRVGDKNIHRYLYDNNSKLTTFERDLNNKQYNRNVPPKTYIIDNSVTEAKLKDEDVALFNQMVVLWRDKFNSLAFFNLFEGKDEITIANNKKYKAIKDSTNTFTESFEPIAETQ